MRDGDRNRPTTSPEGNVGGEKRRGEARKNREPALTQRHEPCGGSPRRTAGGGGAVGAAVVEQKGEREKQKARKRSNIASRERRVGCAFMSNSRIRYQVPFSSVIIPWQAF